MRKVKVHKDNETGELYILIRSVLYGTGVSVKDVSAYKIAPLEDGFTLELYDKNNNKISLKERK